MPIPDNSQHGEPKQNLKLRFSPRHSIVPLPVHRGERHMGQRLETRHSAYRPDSLYKYTDPEFIQRNDFQDAVKDQQDEKNHVNPVYPV